MTDHPLARMLLYRFPCATTDKADPLSPGLVLTDSFALTSTKFTAEFYTGLTTDRTRGLVVASLYSGVLGVFRTGEAGAETPTKPAASKRANVAGKRKSISGAGKGKGRENEAEPMDVDEEMPEPSKRSKDLVFVDKYEVP